MKYGDSELARRYSHVRDYARVNQAAVREMHRQVGDLAMDEDGIARRGLLVRHLVLPNGIAGSEEVVRFLAEEISRDTCLNLMDQYRPCYRADDYPSWTGRSPCRNSAKRSTSPSATASGGSTIPIRDDAADLTDGDTIASDHMRTGGENDGVQQTVRVRQGCPSSKDRGSSAAARPGPAPAFAAHQLIFSMF